MTTTSPAEIAARLSEARVTIPIEWDFQQSQTYDERTMSYRYTVTATPTKYVSVPEAEVRAIIEKEGK